MIAPTSAGRTRRTFLSSLFLALALSVTTVAAADDEGGPPEAAADAAPPESVVPEEDPDELFDLQIGDAEADVFVTGRWETVLAGATGLAILSEPVDGSRLAFPYTFPGLDPAPLVNTVDLTISIWLFDHYYVEATVIDELELGTLVFGYEGETDAFLRSVRIGTDTFSMSPYPYLSVTAGEEPAIGAYLRMQNEVSTQELLLQYQSAETVRDVYAGKNLLSESILDPASYIRGQYFVLPDRDVENLQVYLEDPDGSVTASDGRSYREADLSADLRASAQEGTVHLLEPAQRRVIVSYTKDGSRVGSPGLGSAALAPVDGGALSPEGTPIDFSFRSDSYLGIPLDSLEVTVEGSAALLLYEPTAFSPFEAQNRYAVPGQAGDDDGENTDDGGDSGGGGAPAGEPRLQERNSGERRQLPGIQLSRTGGTVVVNTADRSRALNRYPFATVDPAYSDLYGPAPSAEAETTPFVIALRSLTEVSWIALPQRVIPGSVEITRNGIPEYGYSVDPSTGAVTFVTPISPLDRIEVRYRVESPGSTGGDATLAYGNKLNAGDKLTVESSLRGNAPLPWNGFTTAAGEKPASTAGAVRVSYSGEALSLQSDIFTELRVPDATGHLRLAGMGSDTSSISIAPSRILPAAPPADSISDYPGLTATSRGRLFYRDYYVESLFGIRSLSDYSATLSEEQRFPYEPGSRVGPYPVAARSDGFSGPVMALEFAVSDAGETVSGGPGWVAGRIQLPESRQDLSTAEGLRLEWRSTDLSGEVSVYLQVGPVDEDTDADGTLDAGSDPLDPRYAFTDAARDFVLEAGAVEPGIGPAAGEDANGNGVVDAAGELVTLRLAASSAEVPAVWKEAELTFTEAQRRLLSSSRAVQIVLVNTGDTEASGRILVGGIEVQGNGFAKAEAGTELVVRERRGADVGADAEITGSGGQSLETARSRFADSGGVPERLLDVTWTDDGTGGGAAGPPAWRISKSVAPAPAGNYEELIVYIKLLELSEDADFKVQVSEAYPPGNATAVAETGARLTATIPSAALAAETGTAGEWMEIRLPVSGNAPLLNGTEAGSLAREEWSSNAELGVLSISQSGAQEGRVLIDEAHWRGSRAGGRIVQRSQLSFRPNWSLDAGAVSLVSGIALDQALTLRSGDVLGDNPIDGTVQSQSAAAAQLPALHLAGRAGAAWERELSSLRVGHTVQIPTPDSPIRLVNELNADVVGESPATAHRTAARVRVSQTEVLTLSFTAQEGEDGLSRSWSADTSGQGLIPGAPAATLRFTERNAEAAASTRPYPDRWIRGFELMDPRARSGATSRRVAGEAELSHRESIVGFTVESAGELFHQISDSQRDTASVGLGLPITLQRESPLAVRVTPAYRRSLVLVSSDTQDPGFAGDLRAYGTRLAEQNYAYRGVPGGELYSAQLNERFAQLSEGYDAAQYSAVAELLLERNPGFRPIDLLIPAGVTARVTRSLDRDDSVLQDSRDTLVRLRSVALNLFGRQGATPMVDSYKTDEYRATAAFERKRSLTDQGQSNTVSWSLDARYFGEAENSLTIVPAAGYTWTRGGDETPSRVLEPTLESIFTWRQQRVPQWELPVISEPVSAVVHSERVSVESSWDIGGGRFDATLVAGHSSAVQFSRRGEIAFAIDIGIGRESNAYQQQPALILGLQGMLTGTLRF